VEVQPLPKARNIGNERILLVDDEESVVNLGRQMLEPSGYAIESSASGKEALAVFRLEPDRFDLVITDLTMPSMLGDRLAKELMRIRPDIPVILCMEHSERASGGKAKDIGLRAFIVKPFVEQQFAETVRRVLDGR